MYLVTILQEKLPTRIDSFKFSGAGSRVMLYLLIRRATLLYQQITDPFTYISVLQSYGTHNLSLYHVSLRTEQHT